MSVEDFQTQIYRELEYERIETEKLIKKLLSVLPNREYDDPGACTYIPMAFGWSQTIEDVLEDAGYDVVFLPTSKEYLIEFSDKTKEEIKEDMVEEAKLQREYKRQKKVVD